jgi:hypothetical protein
MQIREGFRMVSALSWRPISSEEHPDGYRPMPNATKYFNTWSKNTAKDIPRSGRGQKMRPKVLQEEKMKG